MTADSPHLLLVSGNEPLRALLGRFLMRHGFLVTTARDAAHAGRILAGLDFDLIIRDAAEAGADGAGGPDDPRLQAACPLLVLAGAGQAPAGPGGQVAGILLRPFAPEDLLGRLNAILGRDPPAPPASPPAPVLQLGRVRYDTGRGELWAGDRPVRLTATEGQLMRILAAAPGTPLTRARLVAELGRGGGQARERAVDVQITRLRRKVEADPRRPRYLQTVRGEGYRLAHD